MLRLILLLIAVYVALVIVGFVVSALKFLIWVALVAFVITAIFGWLSAASTRRR